MSALEGQIAFPWRRVLAHAALAALVPFALLLAALLVFPDFTLVVDDGRCSYQPIVTDSLNQLLSGSLPLWSHHTACGYPLLARGQQSLYPPYLAARGIGIMLGLPHEEVTIAYLLHLGAGTLLAFLYLRFIGVGLAATLIGAWGYALSGPMLGFWNNWPTYGYLTVWLLLAMLLVERVRSVPAGWFWVCLGGLCGGMVLLITDPMLVVKFCLFMLLYVLLRVERGRFWQMAVPLSLSLVGAALIGAGQMLASTELFSMSLRLTPEVRGNPYHMSLLPQGLVGLVFPFATYPWPYAYCDLTAAGLFVGPLWALALLVPLGLGAREPEARSKGERACALALASRFGLAGPLYWRLLTLFVLYLLLSLGDVFPPNHLIEYLPVFQHFRLPFRWVLELAVLGPLFTAVGIHLLQQQVLTFRPRRVVLCYTSILVAAVLFASANPPETLPRLALAARLVWLAGGGLLMFLLLARRHALFAPAAVGFSLLALVLNMPAAQLNHFSNPDLRNLLLDPIDLPGDPQQRVLYLGTLLQMREPPGEGCFAFSMPHICGSRTVLGYRYRLSFQQWSSGTSEMGEITDTWLARDTFLRTNLLQILRVGYVVIPQTSELLREVCDPHPDLVHERDSQYLRIYRHEGFQAPAFFVEYLHSESELSSPGELGRLPLRAHAYVWPAYQGPRHFAAKGQVTDFQEEHGLIRFKASTAQPGFVVVTTSWYPGWHATVNGQEVPLQRVNMSFLGLAIPPGEHAIELRFRPLGIICWTIAGFAATALLSLMCLVHLLRRLAQ